MRSPRCRGGRKLAARRHVAAVVHRQLRLWSNRRLDVLVVRVMSSPLTRNRDSRIRDERAATSSESRAGWTRTARRPRARLIVRARWRSPSSRAGRPRGVAGKGLARSPKRSRIAASTANLPVGGEGPPSLSSELPLSPQCKILYVVPFRRSHSSSRYFYATSRVRSCFAAAPSRGRHPEYHASKVADGRPQRGLPVESSCEGDVVSSAPKRFAKGRGIAAG